MKTTFEICAFILLAGIPLQLFYWFVVRSALLLKAESNLLRIRAKLDDLASQTTREGKLAVPIIDRKCDIFVRFMNHFDVLRPCFVKLSVEDELRIKREREIIADAPFDVRELNSELEMLAAVTAIINSPGIVVLMTLLAFALIPVAIICIATNQVKAAWGYLTKGIRVSLYYPHDVAC